MLHPPGVIAYGHDIEFEIEPEVWTRGAAFYTFTHTSIDTISTLMCVIRKYTEHIDDDGVYYVRSIGQCRGWR